MGTNGRIELTDKELETGAVISCLLAIMIDEANVLDIPHLVKRQRIVRFAEKYDFTHELRTISLQLQIALSPYGTGSKSPTYVLKLAALLDDHDLCSAALKKAGEG